MSQTSTPRDPYEVLGVQRDADEQQIKKAFRALAMELHPDVNAHDPQAEEKFKEAAEANEILSDPERRATYDRYGHEGLRSGGYAPNFDAFGSISDLFETFFGGSGGGAFGGRAPPAAGGDLAVAVEIDLVQAAKGTNVQVTYEAVERCEHCHGNGAEPGTPIETCERCAGHGQLQAVTRTPFGQMARTVLCDVCQGAPAGDLYVLVRVREDERFVREGDDLIAALDVSAPLAALGATLQTPTLEGMASVEVPPGTQPGEVLTLRGEGMPGLRRGRRGDLRMVVNVMIPRRLSEEQRELLERLNGTLTAENLRSDESMFAKLRRTLRGDGA
jgi:molecular chaperone DnaJ